MLKWIKANWKLEWKLIISSDPLAGGIWAAELGNLFVSIALFKWKDIVRPTPGRERCPSPGELEENLVKKRGKMKKNELFFQLFPLEETRGTRLISISPFLQHVDPRKKRGKSKINHLISQSNRRTRVTSLRSQILEILATIYLDSFSSQELSINRNKKARGQWNTSRQREIN